MNEEQINTMVIAANALQNAVINHAIHGNREDAIISAFSRVAESLSPMLNTAYIRDETAQAIENNFNCRNVLFTKHQTQRNMRRIIVCSKPGEHE